MGQPLRIEDFEEFMGHPVDPSELELMRKAYKFLAGAVFGLTAAALFSIWF